MLVLPGVYIPNFPNGTQTSKILEPAEIRPAGLLGTTTARQRGGFSWRVVSAFAEKQRGTNIEGSQGLQLWFLNYFFWREHFWRVFFFFGGGSTRRKFFFLGWLMVGCFFVWQKQVIHVGWQVAGLTLIYAGLSFLKTHWGGGNSNIGEDVQFDEYFLDGLKPPTSFLRAFLKRLLFYSQAYKSWVYDPSYFHFSHIGRKTILRS